MKNNNKGYSLVEILIVIAILAVVTSSATISFRLIYNTKVTTSARNVHSVAKAARLNNMTKQKLKYIHIFKSGGLNYMYVDENSTVNMSNKEQQLGSTDMAIGYGPKGGTMTGLREGNSFSIYFDRSGRCYLNNSSGNAISGANSIVFSNGTRSAELNISEITGKVTME